LTVGDARPFNSREGVITVKVTIEISTAYLNTISKWASVSRTLNEAKRLIDAYALNHLMDDSDEQEKAMNCLEELKMVEPMLDQLHRATREALWYENKLHSATK
jgi:hypothetical protein